MAAVARDLLVRDDTRLPRWPRSRIATAVRSVLRAVLLSPLVRRFCHPLRVEGVSHLAALNGPVVFVANHASHADTAVILRALPRRIRRRTAPAAAEDYFFRGPVRRVLASLVVGAFPFPRRGTSGLERAEALLRDGWNVLLFPEGTRSRNGRMSPFRSGIGVLASRGATVVPIGTAGTADVFAKGTRLPRRSPVAVVFGAPVRTPGASVDRARIAAQRAVTHLHLVARLRRPRRARTWFERARDLARSPAGLWLAFAWGVAEALWWPVVPDVPVALLAAAAPGRVFALAGAAIAGSMAGGTLAYALGAAGAGGWLLTHAPLVTDRMIAHAGDQLSAHGWSPFVVQPWTGIPFKVFGYQAAGSGVGAGSFLAASLVGRGARIVAVGAVFAGASGAVHRIAPRHSRRLYTPFAITALAAFGIGLARVVAFWS